MDQNDLHAQIEAIFAQVEPSNLREMSRRLEGLVRQIEDPAARKRYEAAIDQLPDMVAHLDSR